MDRTVCVYKPKFHLARHVSTQHDTTRSTCRAHAFWPCRACRTARLDTLDTTSATGATRNLVCFVICTGYDNVSYSLIYWSIHLFNLFHLKEQIGFVYVRAQTTKLVQASTIASSSSAMSKQARLDALDTWNVSRRDEPSGIWATVSEIVYRAS